MMANKTGSLLMKFSFSSFHIHHLLPPIPLSYGCVPPPSRVLKPGSLQDLTDFYHVGEGAGWIEWKCECVPAELS